MGRLLVLESDSLSGHVSRGTRGSAAGSNDRRRTGRHNSNKALAKQNINYLNDSFYRG